ncbi:hypothetical protein HN011_000629 [Eciton burchellii]|nr:hypothetical protein HN011_000629 [Eciton burchellii]
MIDTSHIRHRGTHLYIVNVVEIRVLHFFDVTLRNSTGKSVNTTVAALRYRPSRRAYTGRRTTTTIGLLPPSLLPLDIASVELVRYRATTFNRHSKHKWL